MIKTLRLKRRARLYTDEQLNKMKLHRLFSLALADAKLWEKRGQLNMDMWVTRSPKGGPCRACLAGAVVLLRRAVTPRLTDLNDPTDNLFIKFNGGSDSDTCGEIPAWARAVDAMRRGRIGYAAEILWRPQSQKFNVSVTAGYSEDPRQWWLEMRVILNQLREADI